jgi:hypothetical protein
MTMNPQQESVSKTGKWSKEEDSNLKIAVTTYGAKDWRKIAEHLTGRTGVQCSQRWLNVLKPGLHKGHWNAVEDSTLRSLVEINGKKWKVIAEHIPGRTAKQVRERYDRHLDPAIRHGPFNSEEDYFILAQHKRIGNKWSKIAKMMDHRTGEAVKNRAYVLLNLRAVRSKTEPKEVVHQLAKRIFQSGLVKDRSYRMQTFRSVIVGREAVEWMVDEGVASCTNEAVVKGQALIDAGLLSHVTKDHEFSADFLFYRFTVDSSLAHANSDENENTKFVAGVIADIVSSNSEAVGNRTNSIDCTDTSASMDPLLKFLLNASETEFRSNTGESFGELVDAIGSGYSVKQERDEETNTMENTGKRKETSFSSHDFGAKRFREQTSFNTVGRMTESVLQSERLPSASDFNTQQTSHSEQNLSEMMSTLSELSLDNRRSSSLRSLLSEILGQNSSLFGTCSTISLPGPKPPAVLEVPSSLSSSSLTPAEVGAALIDAMKRGVPLWNKGDVEGCTEIYKGVCRHLALADTRFSVALVTCEGRPIGKHRQCQGWVLRDAMDMVLKEIRQGRWQQSDQP